MFRTRIALLSLVLIASLVVSCTDRTSPTETARAVSRRASAVTLSELQAQIMAVFGTSEAKMPNTNSALQKLDLIDKKLQRQTAIDTLDAQAHARSLIEFIRLKAYELTDRSQVQALIDGIESYVGITDDTFLLFPSSATQTVVVDDGQAGLQLPGNSVSEPVLITIADIDPTTSPLVTKLDQYPGYIEVTQSSGDPDGNALNGPVTVAVCPAAGIPDSIASRLRLGHQAAPGVGGFVVTPPADASFLSCVGYASAPSRIPNWVQKLASLVMPKPLYARMTLSGGVGGTAEAFSPFGPVDPVLNYSGGVGGTAEAFIRALVPSDAESKKSSGSDAVTLRTRRMNNGELAVPLATCDVVIGSPLPATCRPRVELKTVQGTVLANVPVSWAIGSGGGVTAADDPATRVCGVFGPTASTTTNERGKAGACWTLGMTAVSNTLVATPSVGGDVPVGATFSPTSTTFTVAALRAPSTVTVSCTAASFVYSGTAQEPCSATVTGVGGLNESVTVTYANNTNVGTATATATFPGGDNHTESTGTATFTITKAPSTVTVTCGGPFTYTGAALTPCTATATGAGGLNQSVDVTYTNNTNSGTATATAYFAGDANHTESTGTGSFAITEATSTVTVTCGGPYTYTGVALTPCTATATGAGGLNQGVTVTYANSTNVGTASVSATFAGDANHTGATGTGSFAITQATPVLTWATPSAITLGTPLSTSQLNASASYLSFNPLAGSFVYTPPAGTVLPAGTSMLSVIFTPMSGNFTTAGATVDLSVHYVQVGCFSSPVYSEMPSTKSYQRKGSIVPIKCTLTDAQGVGVMDAKGDLLVEDMGTDFLNPASPRTAFSGTNVFKVSRSGNYAYGLDTSPAGFVSGHYYHVTAHWNDGSTTRGYFYIK